MFVAVGDVDADGKLDIILAAGPGGGPHVKVLRFDDLSEMYSFFAYDESFTGGARVAAGDINGDGVIDIITSAGSAGSPHVKVFDGKTATELMSFFAYDESFTGGVWISAADLDQDGRAEILTGTGPGSGPHVKVFDADTTEVFSFFAFEESFTGGVRVGSGDANEDGFPDIETGAGPGGGPIVQTFDGKSGELLDSILVGPIEDLSGVYVG